MKTTSVLEYLGGTSLASALLASVVVHVSALALLTQIAGSPRIGETELPDRSLALEATLVASTEPVTVGTLTPIAAPVATAKPRSETQQPSATPQPGSRQESPRARPSAQPSAGMNRGRVVISDKRPRSDFGPDIEGEAIAGFPAEVQGGIEIPEKFTVEYPPEALSEGREATVLVWVVVDEVGKVQETHFVAGSPGFTEAVEAALTTARFIPAVNDFQPIRFFTTLSFEFRLDAPTATAIAPR